MLHITSDITIHVKWYYKSRQRCYIPRQVFQYMSSDIINHVKGVTCHVRYLNHVKWYYKSRQRCYITSDISIHVKWYYKSRQRCYISRQILQYMSSGIISHVKGVTYHVRYFNHVKWYYKSRQRCYIPRQIFQYMSSGIIMSSGMYKSRQRCYISRQIFQSCQVVL